MSKEIKVVYEEVRSSQSVNLSLLQNEKTSLMNNYQDILVLINERDGVCNATTHEKSMLNCGKATEAINTMTKLMLFAINSSRTMEEMEKMIASKFKLAN